jgi:very-short-patch-repair endonuclease
MHSPATERSRALRNNMSKAEWYLWSRLRGRQLGGFKFRRQVPIGHYFADFACLSARLVIEVDGAGHLQETDARKTACLESHGYRVCRIQVTDLDESIDDVLHAVFLALGDAGEDESPHPGAASSARPPRVAGR